MSADLQVALWGLAVLLPFCINAAWRRDPDALGLSGMIIVGWGIERLCWALWSPPEAMQLYPVMDAIFGAITFSAWLTAKVWWKAALVGLFLLQCALATAFWAGQPASSSLIYVIANNITLAVELCVVASPGVASGVRAALAVLASSRVLGGLGFRYHTGP